MTDYQSPKIQLTQEHQQLCLKTLKFLHELGPEVEKLRASAIDTTAWEQLRQRLIEINQTIGQHYCRTP